MNIQGERTISSRLGAAASTPGPAEVGTLDVVWDVTGKGKCARTLHQFNIRSINVLNPRMDIAGQTGLFQAKMRF